MTSNLTPADNAAQGFSPTNTERMPLMARDAMSPAQQQAADELIAGPRKAVFGPFVPLMRSPELMSRIGRVGEYLRFQGTLNDRLRELVTCVAARHVANQFEWLMHAPLALKAGVSQATLDAIAAGKCPRDLPADEAFAIDFTQELLHNHGVCDTTYAQAVSMLGEAGVMELTSLIGYFVMICWAMNVARTPALPVQGTVTFDPLQAFPS
jgi:4-carboxymuconolactone decarboxylase